MTDSTVCNVEAGQQCAECKVNCGHAQLCAHGTQQLSGCKRAVRLAEDPVLGRHLVATRDISAGELILREEYTVLGPKMMSYPICLGCDRAADLKYECSGCGWPLCSEKCKSAPAHMAECAVMQRAGYRASITNSSHKLPDYMCITPLRILLLPEEKRRQIFELQSHLETRKNTRMYQKLLKNYVVKFIRDRLGMADNYSENEILKICAILDTNAFEVISKDECLKVRGLYTLACMMAHDCRPNTSHVFDTHAAILVYATMDIKVGENVTTTYTHTLWGTLERRAHMRRAKCFDCACKRCSDPTELGTYVGAILCSRCNSQGKDGRIISTSPLEDTAPWRCSICNYEMSAKQIENWNSALKTEIDELDKTEAEDMEQFLEKYKNILHTTNSHALQVKYTLSQTYGGISQLSLSELNEHQIQRKIEITQELVNVFLLLEPRLSRMRGLLLFDLQAAKVMKVKLDFEAEKITKQRAQEYLGDAMRMLQEATEILQMEPDMTMLASNTVLDEFKQKEN